MTNKILKNGGFTLQGLTLKDVSKGYACAISGHEEVIDLKDLNDEKITAYMEAKKQLIEKNKNLCFGAWHDTNTDKVYLDLSEVLNDKKTALKKAYKREQLAIFDLNTFESIYLKNDSCL